MSDTVKVRVEFYHPVRGTLYVYEYEAIVVDKDSTITTKFEVEVRQGEMILPFSIHEV